MRPPRIEWRPDDPDGDPHKGRFWDLDGGFAMDPQEVASEYNRVASLLADPPNVAARSGAPEHCLPCVRCGARLQAMFSPDKHDDAGPPRAQPLDAVVFYGAPAYGSEYDMLDDDRRLAINLCDECLAVVGPRGRVNLVRERRVPLTDHQRWSPAREET